MTQAELLATERAAMLKSIAHAHGFSFCGISQAGFLEEEAKPLENWLSTGMHGKMGYMANHFDMRLDPRLLVPGAKSVVSLLFNYYPPTGQADDSAPKISKYAYGEDYHFVLKRKLKSVLAELQAAVGQVEGRVFVDSAPVLERAWAAKSGTGWVGKNANLITRQQGSFFFLAELILDLELATDGPIRDYCGSCTRCLNACPTQAIVGPGVVDGSRCISYFTIELKENIPAEWQSRMAGWAFGCDVCQDVCPWNRFSKPHQEAAFGPNAELLHMGQREWVEMTEETFRRVFKSSAVKRAGYLKLKANMLGKAAETLAKSEETNSL